MQYRRQVLRTLGLAGGGAAAACLSSVPQPSPPPKTEQSDSPEVEWRMATSWPESLDILLGGAQYLCDRVATITSGQFIIIPSAANGEIPALEVMDAVMAGTVDCGHTGSHYYLDKSPALAFTTGIPFGFNAQQQNAWLFQGGGLEVMEPVYRDLGLVHFPAGNTGAQMGGWFLRPWEDPAGFTGLTMRIAGLGGEVMRRLGASVQNLAAADILPAFQSGQIDAAEWIGPHDDMQLQLYQVAPYYYYPGWWSPGETLDFMVNRERWNQLPAPFQTALRLATIETNMTLLNRYTVANARALQNLVSQGVELRPFAPASLQAAQAIARDLYAEIAAENADFQTVYDHWDSFRDRILPWHTVNELSFAARAFPQPDL